MTSLPHCRDRGLHGRHNRSSNSSEKQVIREPLKKDTFGKKTLFIRISRPYYTGINIWIER